MSHRTRIIILLATLTAACGTPPERAVPDWVSGAAGRYPAAQYLLGRGTGGDLTQAGDRARADLAKVFAVWISERSSDEQSFQRAGDGTPAQTRLKVSRSVELRAESMVSGIRIAEVWRDPDSGVYHALAVLERAPAGRALRTELQRLDDATRTAIGQAREAGGDGLAAVAAAQRAVQAQRERAELQRMLQVVDATGGGLPPPWQLAALEADRDQLLARLTLRPEAHGAAADELQPMLAGAAGAAGFTVDPSAARYVLAARLDLNAPEQREGWYWTRGTLTLRLSDIEGRARGEHSWSIKSSAQDPQTSKARALAEVESLLTRELRATLLGFAGMGAER